MATFSSAAGAIAVVLRRGTLDARAISSVSDMYTCRITVESTNAIQILSRGGRGDGMGGDWDGNRRIVMGLGLTA